MLTKVGGFLKTAAGFLGVPGLEDVVGLVTDKWTIGSGSDGSVANPYDIVKSTGWTREEMDANAKAVQDYNDTAAARATGYEGQNKKGRFDGSNTDNKGNDMVTGAHVRDVLNTKTGSYVPVDDSLKPIGGSKLSILKDSVKTLSAPSKVGIGITLGAALLFVIKGSAIHKLIKH